MRAHVEGAGLAAHKVDELYLAIIYFCYLILLISARL